MLWVSMSLNPNLRSKWNDRLENGGFNIATSMFNSNESHLPLTSQTA